MTDFDFKPSTWVPFRDTEVLERVRNITREDIEKHSNPDFNIQVLPDDEVGLVFVADMFCRIKTAADAGTQCVLILPNPNRGYRKVAHLINRFGVNCDHLHTFIMDEWADENGNVAPESYPASFMRAFKRHFFHQIDRELRPPEEQMHGPTTENINDYGAMIADMGGADACYSGPGWTGHVAFIEPDAPEFDAPLDEWRKMSSRIVTLSPFTIAQNSLHGCFGCSGDMAAVPPKAATIGPADVIGAKYRMDMNALTTAGTDVSWQRLVTRLAAHGPVTPKVPTSIHQELSTDFYISETIARNIEPQWDFEY